MKTLNEDRELEQQRLDWEMEQAGLLDPDQPTLTAHRQYRQRVRADFTPDERMVIRAMLGLATEAASHART